jgi:hypothetical protein
VRRSVGVGHGLEPCSATAVKARESALKRFDEARNNNTVHQGGSGTRRRLIPSGFVLRSVIREARTVPSLKGARLGVNMYIKRLRCRTGNCTLRCKLAPLRCRSGGTKKGGPQKASPSATDPLFLNGAASQMSVSHDATALQAPVLLGQANFTEDGRRIT